MSAALEFLPAAAYAGQPGKRITLTRGVPTPQVVTPEQRRAAKTKRKSARAARKRSRK